MFYRQILSFKEREVEERVNRRGRRKNLNMHTQTHCSRNVFHNFEVK